MFLKSLEIENLRAIRSMRLDFSTDTGSPDSRRWTVLLGENGCGKSTVLKAIGLVLAGSEALPRLMESPAEWVRNGTKRARITATISTEDGELREVTLELSRKDRIDTLIRRNAKGMARLDAALARSERNYFVVGYGAFRRQPDSSSRDPEFRGASSRAAQLATLLSPSRDLINIEQWAMRQDYRNQASGRRLVGKVLRKLLPGMKFSRIDKKTGQLIMRTVDGDVSMRSLSEGYQAMAAWTGDMLYRMTETFQDYKRPLQARGLLLLDELDLHLHPIWKRQIVDFMNDAFPRMQIVATTHSPLAVQQCGAGELFVVRRENGKGPQLHRFQGDPSKLRLSDLFLSPLIGLETLDSPKVARLRQEARDIEFKVGVATPKDQKRLDAIKHQLEGTQALPVTEAPAFAELMKQHRERLQLTSGFDLSSSVNTDLIATALKKALKGPDGT